MTLGQMLAWHRSLCRSCTFEWPCGEYLEIVGEYTQPRQIHTGPVAPRTILDVRETIT